MGKGLRLKQKNRNDDWAFQAYGVNKIQEPLPLYATKLKCKICGRAFMTIDALTRHIERKHPEVLQCRSS